jgi:anaerobic magnesium-protoporphyrin IX monomethyl ester cyclase
MDQKDTLFAQDRDWAMVRSMSDYVRQSPQKNLSQVDIIPATKNTSLALVILPEWGVYFPPYNLSRLSAVTRKAGYDTRVYDINVKSYQFLKGKLDYDPWDYAKEWMWAGDQYRQHLHKHLEPIYQEYLDILVQSKPDVIGFTLYYTNEASTIWFATQIKKLLPGTKLIVGGPQAAVMHRFGRVLFNHIVEGEGEQVILDILDTVENNTASLAKFINKDIRKRIDLDSLPFPDYSDFNMNDYLQNNGMSSEISRGCVAKCVFCTEVHFWKYRDRMADRLLNELQYQYDTYGLNFVWFIDSLVNGNLRQLRGFCLGIKERGLKINWQGYARCDGRMDLEYYRDLAAGGCKHLSYGIESGSQRVLDLMKKEITLDEIEDNMLSGKLTGIQAQTNWIVGFPNERHQDFADTLILLWRIRNNNLLAISAGVSLMLSPGSEMTDNQSAYDINPNNFLNLWTTNDLKNTKVHRLIRQKCFHIFIEHLNTDRYIFGCERPRLKETYQIEYDSLYVNSSMDRDKYDYDIIQTDKGDFANSLMNEIWPLLRCLWLALNSYKIKIKFDPAADLEEFGDRLGCNYTASYVFGIDKTGNWHADFTMSFLHKDQNGLPDPNWPDQSFSHRYQGSGSW